MAQSKFNRELANLGVSLANIDMNEGYATQCNKKSNLPLHGAGENNLPPSKTIHSDQNEEVLDGAAAMMIPLSVVKNNSNSTNIRQNSARMKCYFHCEQNYILGYFDDQVLDGAVIYCCIIFFLQLISKVVP